MRDIIIKNKTPGEASTVAAITDRIVYLVNVNRVTKCYPGGRLQELYARQIIELFDANCEGPERKYCFFCGQRRPPLYDLHPTEAVDYCHDGCLGWPWTKIETP